MQVQAPPGTPLLSSARARWAVGLGFLLSGVCLWLFLRKLDLHGLTELPELLLRWPLLVGVSIFLLEFVLRSLRWQLLLSPLGRAPLRSLLSITFISFTASNLVVARSGELVRPWLASHRLTLPLVPVITTTILERVFDLLGLLTVFTLMVLTLPEQQLGGVSPLFLTMLERVGKVGSVLGLLGMGGLFFFATRERMLRALVDWGGRRLPPPLARLAVRVLKGLSAGLQAFQGWRAPGLALLLSGVIWINGALALWIMFDAFRLVLPFSAACFLSVALALAVIPPQAPGFVGVWQLAVSHALMAWGVQEGVAASFALVFWLVSFAPVTAIGIICMFKEGLSLGRLLQDARASAPAESSPQEGLRAP